jgi:hypothetical protein
MIDMLRIVDRMLHPGANGGPTVVYRRDDCASEWVTFSSLEFKAAILVGRWIWQRSHRAGRQDRDGWAGFQRGRQPGKRHQQLGSLAERIAAKGCHVYWPSAVDNFGDADLPHNIEVRLIGRDHYGLRVYPRTHDSRRVVGVVIPPGSERGDPPGSYRYRVAGWFLAGDAKRLGEERNWKMAPHKRPPMYCVPQAELHSVRSLRYLIAEEERGTANG